MPRKPPPVPFAPLAPSAPLIPIALGILFALAAALPEAFAQGGPGPACDDAAPLSADTLMTYARHQLMEPLKMDFDLREDGSADIWFVERAGKVRHYDAKARTVRDAGSMPVKYGGAGNEHGLTGIALDPGFRRNRRLYVAYSANTQPVRFWVARYTLGADGKVDPQSARILLDFPSRANLHTISALKFDRDGNLFISVGDDVSAAGVQSLVAARTDDLRGKILRIRPTEEGGYAIPAGNLFPLQPSGQPQPGTRPEIYVMGVRQPYSLAYDGVTGRLAWGEFGPDQGRMTEEHNVTEEPGNFGWPYFAGRQDVQPLGAGQDPDRPLHPEPDSGGPGELPPARPAVHAYRQSGAVTGPLYRHLPDRLNPSGAGPRLDGLWFLADFLSGWVDTVRLDSAGRRIQAQGRLRNFSLLRPVDFQEGPDGGLYVINYAGNYAAHPQSAILRLVWRGCPVPAARPSAAAARCRIAGSTLHVTGGPHRVRLRDPGGRLVRSFEARAGAAHALEAAGPRGVYLVEVDFGEAGGRWTGKVAQAGP